MSWPAVEAISTSLIAVLGLTTFVIQYWDRLTAPGARLIIKLIAVIIIGVLPIGFFCLGFYGLSHDWNPVATAECFTVTMPFLAISFWFPSNQPMRRGEIAAFVFMMALAVLLAAGAMGTYSDWIRRHAPSEIEKR